MTFKYLLVLTPVCILIACDGGGDGDGVYTKPNSTPVVQISIAEELKTFVTTMTEQSELDLIVSATDTDGEVNRYQWQPEPVEQGALDQCAEVANFDTELAVDSLEAACTSSANCAVTFEQQKPDDAANIPDVAISDTDVLFRVVSPELRAPVGVTYRLDTIDNDGGTNSRQSTFCLIAINEAPDAVDDIFTVLEGQVLTVPSDNSPINLLSNDVQDDHVSNTDLRVLPEPAQAPMLPTSFSLDSEGGFVYAAPLLADQTNGIATDTFVYSVTDGTHISNATVTVNVVAANDAPELVEPIPTVEISVGVEFETDLSVYFSDPEQSTLSFAIFSGALPVSGTLSLSTTGLLSGTAEPNDIGSYTIEVIVSDGSEQIKTELMINVVENSSAIAVPILRGKPKR